MLLPTVPEDHTFVHALTIRNKQREKKLPRDRQTQHCTIVYLIIVLSIHLQKLSKRIAANSEATVMEIAERQKRGGFRVIVKPTNVPTEHKKQGNVKSGRKKLLMEISKESKTKPRESQ